MAYRDREERDALRLRRDELFAELRSLESSDDDAARRAVLEALADVAKRLTALAPTRLPLLSAVRIGAPCPAVFAGMVGTERIRTCGVCDREVWNLTAMDAEEVERFVSMQEKRWGRLRLHRRVDGHFQAGPCAPGAARVTRAVAVASAVGLAGALALLHAVGAPAEASARRSRPEPPADAVDEAVFFGPAGPPDWTGPSTSVSPPCDPTAFCVSVTDLLLISTHSSNREGFLADVLADRVDDTAADVMHTADPVERP